MWHVVDSYKCFRGICCFHLKVVSLNCLYVSGTQYSMAFQKTVLFVLTGVRTSNFTYFSKV